MFYAYIDWIMHERLALPQLTLIFLNFTPKSFGKESNIEQFKA